MIYPPHPQLWSLSQDSSQHSHHKKIQVSWQWHHTTTSIIIIITIMSQATRNRTAAMRRPRGWDRMGGCSRAMMDSHLTHTNPFTLLATSVTKLLRLTTVTSLRELYRWYWWSCWHNGTRKTALMLALCRFLRFKYSLAVTNDIFTKEDGDFLVKNGALAEERIKAIETGGCSYVAIREDISINLGPLEELSNLFKADLLLCESDGG